VAKKYKIACLDTGILYGLGKQIIRDIKKIEKPLKKLKEIKHEGILEKITSKLDYRYTTIITPYEFIRKISKEEGVPIKAVREVYTYLINKFKIIEIIPYPEEIKLSPKLMNELCNYDLDLADGLHILIASKRKMTFITSEKNKLEHMKKFYGGVKSVTEFLKSKD